MSESAPWKLSLDCFPLGEEWQELVAPYDCNQVELTGDKNWEWCTNKQRAESAGASRAVLAGIPHDLTKGRPFGAKPWFLQGDLICWIRAMAPDATIWIKCTF
jgi:hypothetical protein